MFFSFIFLGIILIAISFFSAILGLGGGVFYTPIQVLFGKSVHASAGNSLLFIMVASFCASITYKRIKCIDWHLAIVLMIGAGLCSFCGGYISSFIPDSIVFPLLIACLFISAMSMGLAKWIHPLLHNNRFLRPKRFLWHRHIDHIQYQIPYLVLIPVTMIIGLLSGVLGIGGGALFIPLFIVVFNIPSRIAVGTNSIMLFSTSLMGFIGHILSAHWVPTTHLALAPLIGLGAIVGAFHMKRLNSRLFQPLFSIMTILAGIVVLIKWISTVQ